MVGDAGSIHMRRWAAGIAGRGHAVQVLSERRWDDAPVPVELLPPFVRGRLNLPVLASRVRAAARRMRPDVVHAHYASSYGLIAALSRVRPLVISVWGGDVEVFPRHVLNRRVLSFTLRQAARIAVTSQHLRAVTLRYAPQAPISVIPWGVDEIWLDAPRAAEPAGPFTVVNNKHLEATYGLDLLLAAMAALEQPWVLWLLGSGAWETELRQQADRLGVAERVRWPGQVPPGVVRSIMDGAHAAVFPSRRESFSVATLEASARGLPVIGARTGGLPEVIDEGVTGLLVPPGDVGALSAALARLAGDAGLRARMGEAGRAMVREQFRWETSLDGVLRLYQEAGRS